MKVKALVLTSFIIALALVNAQAFKVPSASKLTGTASTTGSSASSLDVSAVKTRVQNMKTVSDATTETFSMALVSLNSVLASKEQMTHLKETQAAATKKAKKAETNAIAGPVATEAANNLIALADQKDLKEQLKSLSAAQKQQAVDAAFNVGLANLGFASIASESADLVKEISDDPSSSLKLASELKTLKGIAASAPKQVQSSAQVTSAVAKIITASGAKFQAPKSLTEAPKTVTLEDF